MNTLQSIAKQLVHNGKGILAADESMSTCGKRFKKYGIPETPEMRRKWRELLLLAPGIEKGLSGVILFDETIRQETSDGEPFAEYLAGRGIVPGIKVDQKTEPFDSAQGKPFDSAQDKTPSGSPEEEVTKGLEGLSEHLREYVGLGAKFTKWRAVIRIKDNLPTDACIEENAVRMARYALESQKAGLVPIIEPEVLLDGNHSFARCEEVVERVLAVVFARVKEIGASCDGLLLKTSMVLPGKESGEAKSAHEVAKATVRALIATVPKEVAGVVFLSGGQTPREATERLNEIVREGKKQNAPWPLTFSYSRALQETVMEAWLGKDENVATAQKVFLKRVEETAAAARGEYNK